MWHTAGKLSKPNQTRSWNFHEFQRKTNQISSSTNRKEKSPESSQPPSTNSSLTAESLGFNPMKSLSISQTSKQKKRAHQLKKFWKDKRHQGRYQIFCKRNPTSHIRKTALKSQTIGEWLKVVTAANSTEEKGENFICCPLVVGCIMFMYFPYLFFIFINEIIYLYFNFSIVS